MITLKQPITFPAIYSVQDWELPISYYSQFPDSKVKFSIAQPEVSKDSTTSQSTVLTNGINNYLLNYQREESGVSVYEYVLKEYCFPIKNLSRGTITETTLDGDVFVTPFYVSVLPNLLKEEIKFKFGKAKYSESVENLLSSIWLDSGKQVMTYSVEDNGNVTTVFGKSDCFKLFKFLDDDGNFLPSDSFVKLTRVNTDGSNTVIEHYKVLNSYRNEKGEGIDKYTQNVIDSKPVSYVKIDTSTLEVGNYVVQAWYCIDNSMYKSNPTHFEI